jgi:heme-degrading monooxygenase HmoA
MWQGSAFPEKAEEYVKHLQMSVLPELRQIDGFQEVYLMRRDSAENAEFIVLTLWESMDAIHKFAGENVEVAVVRCHLNPKFLAIYRSTRRFGSKV